MKITTHHDMTHVPHINNDDIVQRLLRIRGVDDDISSFLSPPHPGTKTLRDFGYAQEIETAVGCIRKAKEGNRMVVVYTDYDADGITGGAIVWMTLHNLGFKVMPYVPHRGKEGYGFSVKGIDAIKEQYNPAVIISVDHGITAIEQIAYAKSLGIAVIVTDHHLKGDTIPDQAEAIFHIPALSGSAVGYYFAKEVAQHFTHHEPNTTLNARFDTDYLALASIGTVADLVPLTGPARSVVKHGLSSFTKLTTCGLKTLLATSNIADKPISPYEIGFIIAPRINAIGRLEHAIDALRLLCTTSPQRAQALSSKLDSTNTNRQDLVARAVREALAMAEQMKENDVMPPIIVLVSQTWTEGIIGLIAGKITETYHRPCLVITKSEGLWKGSARSIPTVHITDFLRDLKDHLASVGGHKQAGGFALEEQHVDAFVKAAYDHARETISEKDLEPILETDIKIPIHAINQTLIESLEQFEPYGVGNPHPRMWSAVEVVQIIAMGKLKNHMKLMVKHPGKTMIPMELVGFGMMEEHKSLKPGDIIDIVYTPELNRWNGRVRVQGKIKHIAPTQ